jgi:hypothetical protein
VTFCPLQRWTLARLLTSHQLLLIQPADREIV